MSLGLLFWLVFVVWVLFGYWRAGQPVDRDALGYHTVIAVLVFLLGWRVFGFVVHG